MTGWVGNVWPHLASDDRAALIGRTVIAIGYESDEEHDSWFVMDLDNGVSIRIRVETPWVCVQPETH